MNRIIIEAQLPSDSFVFDFDLVLWQFLFMFLSSVRERIQQRGKKYIFFFTNIGATDIQQI